MAEYTVSITAEEATVIEHYFDTVQEGIDWAIKRMVLPKAKHLIKKNPSITTDPDKITTAEIRALLATMEIPSKKTLDKR